MENFKTDIIDPSQFTFPNIKANEYIIGQGGFGIIYKNVLIDIPVAIKFPKNQNLLRKQFEKFLEEYKIIKELNHENIIKAYGFVKNGDSYGIILEQCLGGSLNVLNRSNPNLSIDQKLQLMIKVIKALEYMHMKNICHFDIKPHNILLDINLEPKLTDLGLSRNITERVDPIAGFTLIYCSPEQIKGKNADKKSDVWSFGMTLYCFLTQITPYDYLSNNGRKKLDKNEFYYEIYHQKRIPKIPEKFQAEYPGIVKILLDTWNIDPDRRASSKQVRQALVAELLKIKKH